MEITLFDFESETKTFDIGDLDSISEIEILVLSGDEIALVWYKDHTSKQFDSSDSRIIDYYDGSYIVYNVANETNFVDAWKERKDSYDYSWIDLVG